MKDTKNYFFLSNGYETKEKAENDIRQYFILISGLTTYYDSDTNEWFIVQSKPLAN